MDTSSSTHLDLRAESAFVHRLARALVRDADLAHDVAQDALAAALTTPGRPRHLRAWLARVTERLARAAARDRRQRPGHEARAARPESGDRECDTAARLRLHRRLCDAVLALPEPYRTAVTLRYLDGLPPRIIARRLGRDVVVVRQHVARGLALLRQRLDAEFGHRSWVQALVACGLVGGATRGVMSLVLILMTKTSLLAAGAAVLLATCWLLLERDRGRSAAVASPAVVTRVASERLDVVGRGAPAERRSPVAATPTTSGPRFTVSVFDEAEQPCQHAKVRCWPQDGEGSAHRTDADGRAEFEPSEDAGALWIEADGHPPLLQVVPRLVGERRVVLPPGTVVAGQMLVDGEPAPAGLCVTLTLPQLSIPADVPTSTARWLDSYGRWPRCATHTAANGAFEFTGLPMNWSGAIEAPQNYWVLPPDGASPNTDRPGQMGLLAARSDVVLATTALETVCGRVLWQDTGEDVDEPAVDGVGRFADGTNSPLVGARGYAAGRFAIGFYPSHPSRLLAWLDPARRLPLVSVSLRVSTPDSDQRVDVEVDSEQLQRHEEIVVRLPRPRLQHFRAVAADGAPIAGARVQIGSTRVSPPTTSDGWGTFVGERAVLVGAPGWMVVRARPRNPAQGTDDDPLLFELQPDNELVVRLRTTEGSVPAARHVSLRAAVPLFAGERQQGELDRLFGGDEADCGRHGRRQPDGSTLWTQANADVRADDQGVVRLHSLAPGLACAIVVRDAMQNDVAASSVTLPTAGARATVDLVLAGMPRHIAGRVLDRTGAPLEGVRIELGTGAVHAQANSDRHGRFEFHDVYTDDPVHLVAHKRGFAAQERRDLRRVDDGDLELRLQPGRRVHVCVRDASDQPVPVAVAVVPDLDVHGHQNLAPGEQVFDDLPEGRVTFRCTIGGSTFELAHDTARPEVILRVPTPALVELRPPADLPAPDAPWQLAVQATRLDLLGPPLLLPIVRDGRPPQLLLPGRYRFETIARDPRDARVLPLPRAASAVVDLQAGTTTPVTLR